MKLRSGELLDAVLHTRLGQRTTESVESDGSAGPAGAAGATGGVDAANAAALSETSIAGVPGACPLPDVQKRSNAASVSNWQSISSRVRNEAEVLESRSRSARLASVASAPKVAEVGGSVPVAEPEGRASAAGLSVLFASVADDDASVAATAVAATAVVATAVAGACAVGGVVDGFEASAAVGCLAACFALADAASRAGADGDGAVGSTWTCSVSSMGAAAQATSVSSESSVRPACARMALRMIDC